MHLNIEILTTKKENVLFVGLLLFQIEAIIYVVVENVMTPMDEEALGFFTENGYDSSSATGGSGGTWTYLSGGTVDPNVPEPTALALLALGVAGVALRRRVA